MISTQSRNMMVCSTFLVLADIANTVIVPKVIKPLNQRSGKSKHSSRIIIKIDVLMSLLDGLKTNNMVSITKANSEWKTQFQIIWENTPKRFRRTITQINNIRSQAKIYASFFA